MFTLDLKIAKEKLIEGSELIIMFLVLKEGFKYGALVGVSYV